ncbi:hypothetical protein COBT_002575, partial [Conglomerata obtusa]
YIKTNQNHIYSVHRGSYRDGYEDDGKRYNQIRELAFDRQFGLHEFGQSKCLFDDDNNYQNPYEPVFNSRGNNNKYNDGRAIENCRNRDYIYAEPIRHDHGWNNNQRKNVNRL